MKTASPIKTLLLTILLSSAGLPFASYAGPECGDGVVEGDEDCDPENVTLPTSYCADDCTWTFCGDGVVQDPNGASFPPGFSEECDDRVS